MPLKRHSPLLTRWLPLACLAIAVGLAFSALGDKVLDFRFRQQSRATLLKLQRALQDYHVAEETYPRKTPMTGAELVRFLTETGHLKTPPLNPWTRQPYPVGDPTGSDGIRYRTDEFAETYSLESLRRDLAAEAFEWQLDSTIHQSLE
ncbi:MAG: hypothetical protein KDL87_04760 [Verrucomicrobiae bacterium]|nr:hypothetical protein [Verrucomicrobiae bacterium]